MSHYDEQREQMAAQNQIQREEQLASWEAYAKAREQAEIPTTKRTVLSELIQVFKDTREDCNLTFRGFLIGNYPLSVLKHDFPNLYKYIQSKRE